MRFALLALLFAVAVAGIAAVPSPRTEAEGVTVTAVSAGKEHTCALTAAGGVKCWGTNWVGQLGDGTGVIGSTVPVDVCAMGAVAPCSPERGNVLTGMAAISAGGEETCALTDVGGVKCWGGGYIGERADPPLICFFGFCWPVPGDVPGLESGVTAVSAGTVSACAVTNAGGVKCWGDNTYGQLGDGTQEFRTGPVDVVGLASGVASIAASGLHTCALTTAGGVKCWGNNHAGQVGDGTYDNRRLTPVDVVGLESGVAAIDVGLHTCALTTAGGVKCWGSNFRGELGVAVVEACSNPLGTFACSPTPVDATGLQRGVTAIAVGGSHACVLMTTGAVKCWGNNSAGQLGIGGSDLDPHPVPMDVVGLQEDVVAIDAGGGHTCAISAAGGLQCWGGNLMGQLGDDRACRYIVADTCPRPVDVVGLGPKPTPTPTTPTAFPTETTPPLPTVTATPTTPLTVSLPSTGEGKGDSRWPATLWAVVAMSGAAALVSGWYGSLSAEGGERGERVRGAG